MCSVLRMVQGLCVSVWVSGSEIGRGVEMRAGYEKWSGFCKNCRGLSVRRVFGC